MWLTESVLRQNYQSSLTYKEWSTLKCLVIFCIMYAVFNAANYYKRDVDEWMALIAKIDTSANLSLYLSG